jgi:hypothetical protein
MHHTPLHHAILAGLIALSLALPAWAQQQTTMDIGAIPQLLLPALSLTIVGLAVAAGVSQSYPEQDGSTPNASRDFVTGDGQR